MVRQAIASESNPNPPSSALEADASGLAGCRDESDMDPALEEWSSAASGNAQARYEEAVFSEAVGIVDGRLSAAPSVEHLRVLLARFDRSVRARSDDSTLF